MAVFLMNSCKFQGCNLNFGSLGELIQHIEEAHIDKDPHALEKQELQQPAALALSYVLRLFTDGPRKEGLELAKKSRPRVQPLPTPARSNTPTGSEMDEESMGSDEEDSDDSWTTQEEFSSELILRCMMQGKDTDGDKPYSCPVPGCKKRYKNVNGMKYHAKHGHKKDTKVKKQYRCSCGKSYKTATGLRSHSITHHPTTDILAMMQRSKVIPVAQLAQVPQVTAVQATAQGNNVTLPITMVTQAIQVAGQPGMTPIPIAAVAVTASNKKEHTSPQAGSVPLQAASAPSTPTRSIINPVAMVTQAPPPVSMAAGQMTQLIPTSTVKVAVSGAAPTTSKAQAI